MKRKREGGPWGGTEPPGLLWLPGCCVLGLPGAQAYPVALCFLYVFVHDLYGAGAFGNIVSELQLNKGNESFESLCVMLELKTRQNCANCGGTGAFLMITSALLFP